MQNIACRSSGLTQHVGLVCSEGNPNVFMLSGPELLSKVKELGDVSKSELVRECGYVSTKKDGSERYYEEGELKRETQYKKGKKDGQEMQKRWNGETLSYYKNGKKDGFETKYNKNGKIYDGKEYRNGKIVYEIEEIINE